MRRFVAGLIVGVALGSAGVGLAATTDLFTAHTKDVVLYPTAKIECGFGPLDTPGGKSPGVLCFRTPYKKGQLAVVLTKKDAGLDSHGGVLYHTTKR